MPFFRHFPYSSQRSVTSAQHDMIIASGRSLIRSDTTGWPRAALRYRQGCRLDGDQAHRLRSRYRHRAASRHQHCRAVMAVRTLDPAIHAVPMSTSAPNIGPFRVTGIYQQG